TRVERLRVPRWAAILIVYAITLGSIGWALSAMVPRLVAEGRAFGAEWPHFTATARDDWLPAIDKRLAAWSGRPPAPTRIGPEGEPPEERPAPFRLTRLPDGSYDVRVADGVQLKERRDGVWTIEQVEKTRVVSSAELLRDGFDKATTYLSENSFELINIG